MNTRPEIIISTTDAQRLEALLASLPNDHFFGRDELEAELGRATIVEPGDMPPNVVTMNSTVKFTIESSNTDFELTLVYPKDAGASDKTVSILAPVGSALLGLSQGDEIDWPKPGGGLTRVKVKEVIYQPERAKEFQR